MEWKKKYRWARTWPDDRDIDGEVPEDYSAYDGDQYAGRIYLDKQTLKAGQWRWAGSCPKGWKGSPIAPNSGWKPTAAEAAQTVEGYWDRMKERNGLTLSPPPKEPGQPECGSPPSGSE